MGLSIRQISALQRRGVFPHHRGHRSHEITLQGLAWVAQCAGEHCKSGRVVMGEPLLARVADMPDEGYRALVVQAVRLLPYSDMPYFQMIAYEGKTPPPIPWLVSEAGNLTAIHEVLQGSGCPFSVVDGYPVWLRLSPQEQVDLTNGEVLRFPLVESESSLQAIG